MLSSLPFSTLAWVKVDGLTPSSEIWALNVSWNVQVGLSHALESTVIYQLEVLSDGIGYGGPAILPHTELFKKVIAAAFDAPSSKVSCLFFLSVRSSCCQSSVTSIQGSSFGFVCKVVLPLVWKRFSLFCSVICKPSKTWVPSRLSCSLFQPVCLSLVCEQKLNSRTSSHLGVHNVL